MLRKLAIGYAPLVEQAVCPDSGAALAIAHGLDERTLSLVRIAALIALDAEPASYLRECNTALASGVSGDEIVGALIAVASLTGSVRVIAAAPRVALGLGYDVEDALENPGRSDRD
jgi:alkylhydroperoxidase/carboxymuconolactone decarboxylase family protein YurZ